MENQTNPTTDNPLDEASQLSIVNCQLSIVKSYFPNLTDTQQAQLDALYPLYADWNAKINVISRKDIGNLYLHHVLHSLGIMQMLRFDFRCQYDEKDSIGKRYRRQDAIGTPYCITVDHDTLKDNCVTIRFRDTMEQERVSIDQLHSIISEKVSMRSLLKKIVEE